MRVVSLNLRLGGARRAAAIADYLASTEADVLLLQESYPSGGRNLVLDVLRGAGYDHQVAAESDSGVASAVAITSRQPLEAMCQPLHGADRQRVLQAVVGGVTLVTAYFPSRAPFISRFWREALLPLAGTLQAGPTILLGDWNSGSRLIDEDRATFSAHREFEALAALGWTDAWRATRPQGREYTWYSAAGNGFRLDHAFASESALPRLRACRYDHSTRESGISDHSALVLEYAVR